MNEGTYILLYVAAIWNAFWLLMLWNDYMNGNK